MTPRLTPAERADGVPATADPVGFDAVAAAHPLTDGVAEAREVARLRQALAEARRFIVVACGDTAPYVRVALASIDAALGDWVAVPAAVVLKAGERL